MRLLRSSLFGELSSISKVVTNLAMISCLEREEERASKSPDSVVGRCPPRCYGTGCLLSSRMLSTSLWNSRFYPDTATSYSRNWQNQKSLFVLKHITSLFFSVLCSTCYDMEGSNGQHILFSDPSSRFRPTVESITLRRRL